MQVHRAGAPSFIILSMGVQPTYATEFEAIAYSRCTQLFVGIHCIDARFQIVSRSPEMSTQAYYLILEWIASGIKEKESCEWEPSFPPSLHHHSVNLTPSIPPSLNPSIHPSLPPSSLLTPSSIPQ